VTLLPFEKRTELIGTASIDSVSGSYDWAAPTALAAFSFFGLKLHLDSDPTTFQYSTYFSISGSAASSTLQPLQLSQPAYPKSARPPQPLCVTKPILVFSYFSPRCVTHPITLHNFVILSIYLSNFLLPGHQLQQWPQLRCQSRNRRRRCPRWHPSLGSHSIHILPVRQTGRHEE
jgi:hypothetical protein